MSAIMAIPGLMEAVLEGLVAEVLGMEASMITVLDLEVELVELLEEGSGKEVLLIIVEPVVLEGSLMGVEVGLGLGVVVMEALGTEGFNSTKIDIGVCFVLLYIF